MGKDLEQMLHEIVSKFDSDDRLLVSTVYGEGGTSVLSPRLLRAAMNQIDNGDATVSRYAIWSNTVRDHISSALHLIEDGDMEEARRLMIAAHNSLSAFSEIQKHFDPFKEA